MAASFSKSSLLRYGMTILESVVLAFLFVLQTQLFNVLLRIVPQLYLGRCTIVSFSLGMLFYGPAIFLRAKWKILYLYVIATILSAIFIAEFLYYSYSGAFLQASALAYASQSADLVGTVTVLLTPKLLWFISNLLFLTAIFFLFRKKTLPAGLANAWEILVAFFLLIATVMGGYGYLYAKEHAHLQSLLVRQYDQNAIVGKMGIVNYFLWSSATRYLDRTRLTVEDERLLAEKCREPSATTTSTRYQGIAEGRNLILILVESLEQAVIRTRINGQEITPRLNALTDEGLYFSNHYAQTGLGTTADAEFAILNSLYPLSDEVAYVTYAHNRYRALPSLLAEQGYRAYTFHGDTPTFWNRSNIYPQFGFTKSYTKNAFTVTRPVGYGDIGDEDFFQQSLPAIASFEQPFMAMLITLSSHTPFVLPQDLQTLTIPADAPFNENQKNYLQSVHYVDKAIGTFIDGLKRIGRYENSLIIVLGDHGSFTRISEALNIKQTIPNQQVPLILVAPGMDLHGTVDVPTGHVDLYPTIANLLGLQMPCKKVGLDMLNAPHHAVTLRRSGSDRISAIIAEDRLYTAHADGVFEHGKCRLLHPFTPTSTDTCIRLHRQSENDLRLSDLLVRTNQIRD